MDNTYLLGQGLSFVLAVIVLSSFLSIIAIPAYIHYKKFYNEKISPFVISALSTPIIITAITVVVGNG